MAKYLSPALLINIQTQTISCHVAVRKEFTSLIGLRIVILRIPHACMDCVHVIFCRFNSVPRSAR
eukprot:7635927-Lingulodinium_polyedra.AAC.1